MHLPEHGRIGVGLPADFVIFRGRRYSELLSRPQYDRVRGGRTACSGCKAGLPLAGCSPTVAQTGGWCRAKKSTKLLARSKPAWVQLAPSLKPRTWLLTLPALPSPVQVVVRAGVPLDCTPPSYEELDYVPSAIKTGGARQSR